MEIRVEPARQVNGCNADDREGQGVNQRAVEAFLLLL
jgi:hypothetical protein